ncbi:bifunctional phosphopantothenoylcysteine decarboxylase/phosphopantothenate--cysteine ligase CoaBC [Nannocystis bainbridge]|uniref:Coenzyme A biosynthesis bifunctional protein CoaBC n=1 Tax=Nannocystis bainbridge TaxID=2995303 RepID=A0ABT5DSF9_9BACT|nr:bifunctional phosphopantothenoylcysteine decarboxylase/phosphopantothenate--cysteine ligase CoaBC [Nannocystis bainbridge]MDC0715322.1 bifunctional phosphopantothenoylcysteine decarboxylase/phosphopantothenate--cysteine ligase CoaBC [Nannocystis bainbridge]
MSSGTRPRGRRVLLIVSGGIAAYKTPELVRAFVAAGCEVQVVMTPAAAAFVSELSLATVSTRPVRKRLLDPEEEGHVGHIELADWPDLVVVAPATADLLARATAGMADDLAATVLLATRAPVLWAPAMNTNMWRHPATQANLATLRTRGAEFVGPDRGQLACGWIGEGRMIDPPLIVAAALARLRPPARGPWTGKRVLVSAGPTRTYIDPVRFVTNASTGAMGFALAEAARSAGAEVTLVAGPVELATPPGVRRVDVETAEQMFAALEGELSQGPYDWVAMVAAVQDLEIDGGAARKLEKAELLARLPTFGWRAARDILAALTARFGRGAPAGTPRSRFLGFAAQTVEDGPEDRLQQELIRLGEAKLRAKGADAIFVNRVGAPGVGFASATNAGLLLTRDVDAIAVNASGPPIAKAALATWLLDALAAA